MQLFMCCLLIPSLASVVGTAPVRARRDNVLSFITDAMEKARTTERIPANITGNRHPPSKPATGDDSEDVSEANSEEDFDTNGFKDDSHEIIPAEAPPRRDTAAEQVHTGLVDTSRSAVQDSDEEMMLGPYGVENTPGRQTSHLPGGRQPGSPSGSVGLQRKAGIGGELNGSLAHGGSRELQDGDSVEDSNGGFAPRGIPHVDYDGKTPAYTFSNYRPEAQANTDLMLPQKREKTTARRRTRKFAQNTNPAARSFSHKSDVLRITHSESPAVESMQSDELLPAFGAF